MAIGGLPGAALYKAINTADSMIGHRTPRHQAFGWAAARLDDLVNLPASRLIRAAPGRGGRIKPGRVAGAAWRAVRARRGATPLAECGLAGSRDGGRARPFARRTARLWRRRSWRTPLWAMAGARRRPPISAARSRSIAAADALLIVLLGVLAARAHRASLSRRSISRCVVEMRGERVERALDPVVVATIVAGRCRSAQATPRAGGRRRTGHAHRCRSRGRRPRPRRPASRPRAARTAARSRGPSVTPICIS